MVVTTFTQRLHSITELFDKTCGELLREMQALSHSIQHASLPQLTLRLDFNGYLSSLILRNLTTARPPRFTSLAPPPPRIPPCPPSHPSILCLPLTSTSPTVCGSPYPSPDSPVSNEHNRTSQSSYNPHKHLR
eukprot:GHVQ01013466.1.p1 GENE.GHVQ01013466.1~~GHVQ01013466.1.p1  ORF type:complete len:133 (-),score=19.96 GHVQ01013466.1:234-632(-)